MADTVKASVPLSSSTTEPPLLNPEAVPPMVKSMGVHATATFVTSADTTPGPPFATWQLWPAGCAPTASPGWSWIP